MRKKKQICKSKENIQPIAFVGLLFRLQACVQGEKSHDVVLRRSIVGYEPMKKIMGTERVGLGRSRERGGMNISRFVNEPRLQLAVG